MSEPGATPQRIVLVTGLSGAGKTSILHALEDLGYQTIDNLRLDMIGEVVAREAGALAIGVDARTRTFTAAALLGLVAALREDPALRPELVYATASQEAVLRRYTESRRRHPLAPVGRIVDGMAAEAQVMEGLREAADLLIDTTELPAPALRRLIEARFGGDASRAGLTVALISFAYPAGLPREADLVFDVRFLRNPHYIASLRPLTGLDAQIARYVEDDPDYAGFFGKLIDLLQFLLPRFVQEGKSYVTVAIGCTGGRHRSVHVVESLLPRLVNGGWRVSRSHRELVRENAPSELEAARAGEG